MTKRRIRYRHPLYPRQVRSGLVLYSGRDGCVVRHDDSGHEERVRHEDILEEHEAPDDDTPDETEAADGAGGAMQMSRRLPTGVRGDGVPLLLLKSSPRSASPAKVAAAASRVGARLGTQMPAKGGGKGGALGTAPQPPVTTPEDTLPKWAISRRLPYNHQDTVQYQRPDMAVPEVGRIESMGRHGAVVSSPEGGWRNVRWEHVTGPSSAHARPEEMADAHATLRGMGVPLDEADEMLAHGAAGDRPNEVLLARVKALAADGAPLDPARAPHLSAHAVKRAIERFTGPLPDEDAAPQEPKPKRGAPAPKLNPWREDEE